VFGRKKKQPDIDPKELAAQLKEETRQINEVEAKRSQAIDAAEAAADKILNDD